MDLIEALGLKYGFKVDVPVTENNDDNQSFHSENQISKVESSCVSDYLEEVYS